VKKRTGPLKTFHQQADGTIPVPLLSRKRINEYAEEHIPYRITWIEMGIFACLLIGRGHQSTPGPLTVAGWTFKESGKSIFLNMAVESAIVYCRVLLNFLGVYKRQNSRVLESRGPRRQFRDTEIWIERFPNGRLLSTRELCQPWEERIHPLTVRARIIDTLDAASRGVAHLTVPRRRSLVASKLKVQSLLITCMAVRHHLQQHFYRRTLNAPHPPAMDQFDQLVLKKFERD
jgi:hypothetical protein